MSDLPESYSPQWCPHVVGRHERRRVDPETGMPEEQRFEVECTWPGCGAVWKGVCSSGNVRQHVARFASAHYHKNPMSTT